MKLKNLKGHFCTVMHHKRLVMHGCFKVGLYWQGVTHDLSKFMPQEFLVGVKYYQGDRSPNNAERECNGYSAAWLHHKGRNKHHYEYWVDYSAREIEGAMKPAAMPRRYVIEMFLDRIAASKTYLRENYSDSSPLEYYLEGNTSVLLHPKTTRQLEKLLYMLAEDGEEKTFSYIKYSVLAKNKRRKNLYRR